MSGVGLIRWAGSAAVLGGVLRAAASFVPAQAPTTALEVLYFFTDVLILFGVMGVYAFQHEESGRWGFAGFVLSVAGVGILVGPDGEVSGVSVYPIGALLFSCGLLSLAVGSLVARKLPRWAPILWALSVAAGSAGFLVSGLEPLFVASGVLFGVGFAGAGARVWSAAGGGAGRGTTFGRGAA